MKRLFILVAALVSSFAFGATLVPVQLLNPTGSSSGQAIVSTGASSAPAWGGVGVNGIAAIAANTVLANATGSSASPTAFAMPSCSTSASALNWTTSTGFTCNTAVNAAQLGGQTFTGSPTITTPAITGVINGSTAAAGNLGQTLSSTSGAVSLTNNTALSITNVSLTAGDWMAGGTCTLGVTAGTESSYFASLSTTNNTNSATPFTAGQNASSLTTPTIGVALPIQFFNVTTTTPLYAVAVAIFSSTATATCNVWAVRIH